MLKSAWEKSGHLLIIIGVAALVYFVGSGAWGGELQTRWYWMIGIMAIFVMALGATTNGRLDGALIDWRNKMSLARLQVILWTIIGMSAFLTIGLARIAMGDNLAYDKETAYDQAKEMGEVACLEGVAEDDVTEEVLAKCPPPDALQIVFPEELLLAMGISVASFAGSALVKRNQSNTSLVSADEEKNIQDEIRMAQQAKDVAGNEVEKITKAIEEMKAKLEEAKEKDQKEDIESAELFITEKEAELKEQQQIAESAGSKFDKKVKELEDAKKAREEARGLLHVNEKLDEAKWSDIFTKELTRESKLIDLSKLQMFFFTITVIFAYAAALNNLMQDAKMIENPFGVALPLFSASLVVLLGISHGGYLAIKNTNTTATGTKNN